MAKYYLFALSIKCYYLPRERKYLGTICLLDFDRLRNQSSSTHGRSDTRRLSAAEGHSVGVLCEYITGSAAIPTFSLSLAVYLSSRSDISRGNHGSLAACSGYKRGGKSGSAEVKCTGSFWQNGVSISHLLTFDVWCYNNTDYHKLIQLLESCCI